MAGGGRVVAGGGRVVAGGGRVVARDLSKNLMATCRDDYGKVMDYSLQKEGKSTAQVFIHHHGAIQSYTAISWLASAPSRP